MHQQNCLIKQRKIKKKVDQRSGQNEQTIMSRALCIVDQSLLKYISDDIVQPDYIFCLMIHTQHDGRGNMHHFHTAGYQHKIQTSPLIFPQTVFVTAKRLTLQLLYLSHCFCTRTWNVHLVSHVNNTNYFVCIYICSNIIDPDC